MREAETEHVWTSDQMTFVCRKVANPRHIANPGRCAFLSGQNSCLDGVIYVYVNNRHRSVSWRCVESLILVMCSHVMCVAVCICVSVREYPGIQLFQFDIQQISNGHHDFPWTSKFVMCRSHVFTLSAVSVMYVTANCMSL